MCLRLAVLSHSLELTCGTKPRLSWSKNVNMVARTSSEKLDIVVFVGRPCTVQLSSGQTALKQ